MVPLIVLLVSFAILRGVGLLGIVALNNIGLPLRIALGLMFLVTASAHWGRGRVDLIRMVPPAFPHPELLVTVTGVLEILGAVGLLVPFTTHWAAICLAILLVALFPANVHAARKHLRILGRAAPSILVRGIIQLVFISALVAAAIGNV